MSGKCKIEMFDLDHTKVTAPYVKLEAKNSGEKGDIVTKFDIRFCQPNKEFMTSAELHTLEHLICEYIRDEMDGVIDLSPMGCRTGFSLTIFGDLSEEFIAEHMLNVLLKVSMWNDPIPQATEKECGNYRDHDLNGAKEWAAKWVAGIQAKGYKAFENS